MSNNRTKWKCLDCKVDTGKIGEHYFVNTEVWLSVVKSKNGMLCIGCLENRLGRVLTPADFTKAYINSPKFEIKSKRLMSRMGMYSNWQRKMSKKH